MDNKTIILNEFEKLKGQFVITDGWVVERLVAIAEDEWDLYWVTYDGRKLTFNTCVGTVIQLKDKIEDKAYQRFISLAKGNHLDQLRTFVVEELPEDEKQRRLIDIQAHKAKLMNLTKPDQFLTEVCWDLN